MDLSYKFSSLIAALSKLLDFRGRLRPQMASNRKNKEDYSTRIDLNEVYRREAKKDLTPDEIRQNYLATKGRYQ